MEDRRTHAANDDRHVRTKGDIHFGDVGTLALPNSRIRIAIPTAFAELASGFRNKRGFEPDVVTPKGTNAFEVALSVIEQASAAHPTR